MPPTETDPRPDPSSRKLRVGDPVRSLSGRAMTVMRVVEEGEVGEDGRPLMVGVWVCFEHEGKPCVGIYKESQLERIEPS